jgi:hypothetical protein
MHRYTVIWTGAAEARLAELWNENPAVRRWTTDAADLIDQTLAQTPHVVGREQSEHARYVVCDPLAVLYIPYEDDRRVHVILVKFWDD